MRWFRPRPCHRLAAIITLLMFGLLAAGFHGPALAVNRALLIGVSDYPALPKRLWLRGPENDVSLMRELLLDKAFATEQIRVLSSRGQRPELLPTRANILQAMRALRAEVVPGDRVMLYLSGHGSQQPESAARGGRALESDGLDEVFLPADVRQWDGQGASVAIPNALLDDEIGEWMDALVEAGAQVWAVFDTCHAGGMARAGARGTRWRAVAPAELGLGGLARAPREPKASMAQPAPTAAGRRLDGRALAFAARGQEATSEEWLPRGAALGKGRLHGVFTYHLAEALRSSPGLTTAQLQLLLRASYARERRISPTPALLSEPLARWP